MIKFSEYGFDAFYCNPGLDGAHEKGGVEGEGGRFRRTHLVPVPKIDSLAELNERIEAADRADDHRRIENRTSSVGADFAFEAPFLRRLPDDPFDPALTLTPRVDRYARISVRQTRYSVPARLIGRRVRVALGASELVIFDGRQVVARHARSTVRGGQVLDLDHYLEVLARKPGALPGATALARARATGVFTAEHEAFWATARRAHGDAEGTRALIEVLLLHRHLPHAAVVAGLAAANTVAATSADVVAVQARKATGAPASASASEPTTARVLELVRPRVELPADTRPMPSVAVYDQLLAHRSAHQ